MNRIQFRGYCQCCGRDQAVVKGVMAKHGYTVEHGWFEGVCYGHQYAPMQVERTQTDHVVAMVRADVQRIKQEIVEYTDGTITPATVQKASWIPGTEKTKPWEEAAPYERMREIESIVWQLKMRAESGEQFANYLEHLANTSNGRPLDQVEIKGPLPAVLAGEVRRSHAGLLTAKYTQGARLYFVNANGSTSWMSLRAWRALEFVRQT